MEQRKLAGRERVALVVHNHLAARQCSPQRDGRAGQVGAGEVGRLVAIVGRGEGEGDAGRGVALRGVHSG